LFVDFFELVDPALQQKPFPSMFDGLRQLSLMLFNKLCATPFVS
jgi:hypothetical protein